MAHDPKIQIRCSDEVKAEWRKACAETEMTYGEFAVAVAMYVQDNQSQFERWLSSLPKDRKPAALE